jgi:hypothetical protein
MLSPGEARGALFHEGLDALLEVIRAQHCHRSLIVIYERSRKVRKEVAVN